MKCRNTGSTRQRSLPTRKEIWIESIELGDLQVRLSGEEDTCRKSFDVKLAKKACG